MKCLLCIYQEPPVLVQEAVTVKAGTAVCREHEGLIRDPNLTLFLANQKRSLSSRPSGTW